MPVEGKGKKRKKEKEVLKPGLKERMTELLELPKEVVLDIPKLTMLGNKNLIIENYKGIVEYDSERIRVNTGIGIIKLTGAGLVIKEITSEDIMVDGMIETMEFLK